MLSIKTCNLSPNILISSTISGNSNSVCFSVYSNMPFTFKTVLNVGCSYSSHYVPNDTNYTLSNSLFISALYNSLLVSQEISNKIDSSLLSDSAVFLSADDIVVIVVTVSIIYTDCPTLCTFELCAFKS